MCCNALGNLCVILLLQLSVCACLIVGAVGLFSCLHLFNFSLQTGEALLRSTVFNTVLVGYSSKVDLHQVVTIVNKTKESIMLVLTLASADLKQDQRNRSCFFSSGSLSLAGLLAGARLTTFLEVSCLGAMVTTDRDWLMCEKDAVLDAAMPSMVSIRWQK
jgi:hypothetical protein